MWRAICYSSVCQLHLQDNVLRSQPLTAEHVKKRPSGHWGTVPGTAWAPRPGRRSQRGREVDT
ncbi:phosphoketolase family protein [Streptomyces sp. NPDC003697]